MKTLAIADMVLRSEHMIKLVTLNVLDQLGFAERQQ